MKNQKRLVLPHMNRWAFTFVQPHDMMFRICSVQQGARLLLNLFGLALLGIALLRLVVLHPLPLAAGLMAGHAALTAGGGPIETYGAFAIATGVVFVALSELADAPWPVVRWPTKAVQFAASGAVALWLLQAAHRVLA